MSGMDEPRNGVSYTTKELIEAIKGELEKIETRLRSLENKVAANRWVAPFLTALLTALATYAIVKT